MRRFVFRVSAGAEIGVGHLARCAHLARELQARGSDVVLLLDHLEDQFSPWLKDLESVPLYPNSVYSDQLRDARLSRTFVSNSTVIVDDYRLDETWERALKLTADGVVVIDDLANRKHECDWLVDARWVGAKSASRYEELVPKSCKQLLGPEYCILSPAYTGIRDHQPTPKPVKIENINKQVFNILLSIGGGGDLRTIAVLMEGFLSHPDLRDVVLFPVVGPASTNADVIEEIARNHERVRPVVGVTDLLPFYQAADLFIGSLGTAMAELNCVALPAITFATTENQFNEQNFLDDLGHYFHITRDEIEDVDALVELVIRMRSEWQRVLSLSCNALIRVDGNGTKRVANQLFEVEESPKGEGSSLHFEALQAGESEATEVWRPKADVLIRPVVDRDINHYLLSRNLSKNRRNMTDQTEIGCLEHYKWWFSNNRFSYVLSDAREPMLYIWHERKSYLGRNYMVGGWFVCSDDCGFDLAALALKWQLDLCARLFPDANWLAVISKQNRFVNLLNRQVGFTPMGNRDPDLIAAQNFFPAATEEYFDFLRYDQPR